MSPTVTPLAPQVEEAEDCCHGYGVCCFRRKKATPEEIQNILDEEDVRSDEVDTSDAKYAGDLGQLGPGQVVTVQGDILPSCERFSVNLLCAEEKGERDIALHLNPRVSQRYVVRNSRLRKTWGTEETAAPTVFPLQRGQPFRIDIFVADESFFIQINSLHFCQFMFRTPLRRVSGVEVRGEGVRVGAVVEGRCASYPSGRPAPPMVPSQPAEPEEPLAWDNPACAVLERGLGRGQQLVVAGRVKLLPHAFYLNLQSSVQLWPHPDIALHVNPRFMAARQHLVIWNSWQNECWGAEERTETSLLAPGTELELRISCEDKHYSVWVGDNLIGIFAHRMPPERVRAVLLQGDLMLSSLILRDTPNRNTTANLEPSEEY